MNKQELIAEVEALDAKYIAHSNWASGSPSGKPCGCIISQIMDKKGIEKDEEFFDWEMHEQCIEAGQALEIDSDLLEKIIAKYDQAAMQHCQLHYGDNPIQNNDLIFPHLLFAEDAKEIFIRTVNYFWQEETGEEPCDD